MGKKTTIMGLGSSRSWSFLLSFLDHLQRGLRGHVPKVHRAADLVDFLDVDLPWPKRRFAAAIDSGEYPGVVVLLVLEKVDQLVE